MAVDIEGRNVLVTGGSGYVGKFVCYELESAGYNPIVVDSSDSRNLSNAFAGKTFNFDIADTSKIKKILCDYKVGSVIHLAASAYVGESVQNPNLYFQNNVRKGVEFLKSVIDSGVENFVFASTCSVYGNQDLGRPFSEGDAPAPTNPYAWTKLIFEQMLESYSQLNRVNYVILRFFNVSGANHELGIGEEHDPETHIVPRMVDSALKGEVLRIFGSDYPTRDGTALRDYVHVTDVAKAHVKSLEYMRKGGKSSHFNLGTGRGLTVLELTQALGELGLECNFSFEKRRDGDPASLFADVTKVESEMGWKAQNSSIIQILNSEIMWQTVKGSIS